MKPIILLLGCFFVFTQTTLCGQNTTPSLASINIVSQIDMSSLGITDTDSLMGMDSLLLDSLLDSQNATVVAHFQILEPNLISKLHIKVGRAAGTWDIWDNFIVWGAASLPTNLALNALEDNVWSFILSNLTDAQSVFIEVKIEDIWGGFSSIYSTSNQ